MKKKKLALALSGVLISPISPAKADYLDQNLIFSGFGTVGAGFSHNKNADYRTTYEANQGVGRTTSRDYGLDSLFGVQADLNIASNLTATAQIESHRLSDGSSTPYFEWANIKYDFTPNVSLRIGRVVAPMFMVSESRSVGYAQTTARLPVDVYLANPISYMDGAGLSYIFPTSRVLYKVNVTGGKLDRDLYTELNAEDESTSASNSAGKFNTKFKIKLINGSAEWGSSKFRLGYARLNLDINSEKLDGAKTVIDLASEKGLDGAALDQQHIKFKGITAQFYDVGYMWDTSRYLFQTEFIRRTADTLTVEKFDSFYVLAGYRIGKWTPYIQFSRSNSLLDKSKISSIGDIALSAEHAQRDALDKQIKSEDFQKLTDAQQKEVNTKLQSLNEILVPIDETNKFLNHNVRTTQESSTWAFGTRWDLKENYDIKFQYERIAKPANSTGFFVNTTQEFIAKEQKINAYSLSLDFVF